eukprot:821760_1
MYSTVDSELEHEHNWICPQCQRENDKARFLCIHDQCDHIHFPSEDGTNCKTIDYQAIPIQVQRELLICGFTKEIILIANVPSDILRLIDQYFPLKFGWDQMRHGFNVAFTAIDTARYERQSQEHSPDLSSIAVANFSIHSKEYETFKWQIKLIRTGYPIFMGFIVCPIADDSNDYYWNPREFGRLEHKNQIGIYCYPSQRSIYRCQTSQPQPLWGRHRIHMVIPPSTHRAIVNGDVFTFEIDFKLKTCHIYHSNVLIKEPNGRDPLNIYPTGSIANKLETNTEIIPAVLLCRGAEYSIKNVTQQLTDQIV